MIAADCHDWARRVRDIVVRDGYATRCGPNLSIQAKSLKDDTWFSIMLPNTGFALATAEEQTTLHRMVTGEIPIPEPPPA